MPTVLVVDNNRAVADSFAVLLRGFGYEVHVAYNGAAAITAAERVEPHAVVTEVALPELDGIQLARRLRQRFGRRIRLVACTAYHDVKTRMRAYAAGFDLVFIKPVTVEEVLGAHEDVGES
jgi:CheY-like chemotaxis protein